MTDARTKQIQEIEVLLAERRKYEQWLAQLDARKDSTPSHVFVKVHRDYSARLGEAQQKLSSESGAVHALATELEESLAKLERQIAERTDERAEAELRASVGEFAGKEWDKLRGKLDGAIADLSGEREGIQRELDTLRALLSEVEPPAVGEPKRDVDDIAFLRSVLGRSTPYSSTPAPIAEAATAPTPAPEPPAEAEAPRASTSARASSVTTARPSTSAAAAPARQSAPELFATPEIPEGPPGPRGTDDERPSRPSGTFGHATPRSSEAVKSLKCQECGTLNYPTEWYCERCGGELAAF
jgi:hypothetical protein